METALEKTIDLITLLSLQQRQQMPSEAVFRDTVLKERINLYAAA